MIPDTPQTLLKKIAEYANGDDTAEWAKFVELYEPVIRLYIMQSGNISAADADDIVQDIFVKLVDVLRNDGYKHERGRFRNYLASMVRRLLIDRHRRETVRQFDMPNPMVGSRVPRDRLGRPGAPHTPSPENLPSNLPDPALIVDMNLVLARHHAAVEHVLSRTMLEERTVAAYREYALEEQPADEVAARHGMTVNNLRQLKYRIDRMIAAIEKQYLF